MNRTFILVSLIILTSAVKIMAQRPIQGFVITAKGDTIRGDLFQSSKDARNQVVHLKVPDQRLATYSAANIRGFGRPSMSVIESKTYAPDSKSVLVKALVKGPISLYEGYLAPTRAPGYTADIRYYLQLPDEADLHLIEPASLVSSLSQLMGDCASINIAQRVSQQPHSYTASFLKFLIEEYTICRYSTKPTPISSPSPYRGLNTRWGIKAGIHVSQLETSSQFLNLKEAKSAIAGNWQVGVFANLGYWNGVSFQTEAMLVNLRSRFTQSIYSGTSLYSINREADFQVLQVRVPLLLRYQAGQGQTRPFLVAGPHVGYELSHSASISDDRSNQPALIEQTVVWPKPVMVGLQVGVGVYVIRPNLPGISLETSYSVGRQGTSKETHLIYKALSLNTAVYF